MGGTFDLRGPFDRYIEAMHAAPPGVRAAVIEVGDTYRAAVRCLEQEFGTADPTAAVHLARLMMEDVQRKRAARAADLERRRAAIRNGEPDPGPEDD